MGGGSSTRRTDRSIALLAGRNTWYDRERPLTVTVRSTSGSEMFALIATATIVLAYTVGLERSPDTPVEEFGPILFALTCLLAAIGPTATLLGSRAKPRSLWVNLPLRAAMAIALVALLFACTDGWNSLLAWPLGIALGCDLALTAYALGWRASVAQWWWSFMSSPAHLGVLGGLVGASIAAGEAGIIRTAVSIYVIIQIWVGLAALTAWSALRMMDIEAMAMEVVRAEAARDLHRRSAHWLHDDICARVRMTTLQVQRGTDSPDDLVGMLDELDFALRLRQLDELIGSGSVRLAEVVQPFLRRAQQHGLVVERVPSYETASTVVGPDTGRQLRHAAAILTANAINAGATRLALDIVVHGTAIELTISDDAGGFDSAHLPVGRGLWSLREELGHDGLVIDTVSGGSRVTTRVPRYARRHHAALAAG